MDYGVSLTALADNFGQGPETSWIELLAEGLGLFGLSLLHARKKSRSTTTEFLCFLALLSYALLQSYRSGS